MDVWKKRGYGITIVSVWRSSSVWHWRYGLDVWEIPWIPKLCSMTPMANCFRRTTMGVAETVVWSVILRQGSIWYGYAILMTGEGLLFPIDSLSPLHSRNCG